eukprot:jgi/Chrzof1/1007/Cz01g36180.t1
MRRRVVAESLEDEDSYQDPDTYRSDREDTDREDGAVLSVHEDQHKRLRSFKTRSISTVAMITGFLVIIYAGHVPLLCLVFTLQILMTKELFQLARVAQKDHRLPGFRAQQWYFFGVATFYLYLR